MTEIKKAGRPAIIKTLGGIEITLPPNLPKALAESVLPIPASLNEIGGIRWIELWLTCKDWIDDKDKYIAELLCLKYQELQGLLIMKRELNVPPLFTHTNKSKTIHPFWTLCNETEKAYLSALKEMGLTPASFASISKLEKIDSNDPVFEAIKGIQEDNKARNAIITEIISKEGE